VTTNTENTQDLVLVWGVSAIGDVIQRSPRATLHMLKNSVLPAKKVGGRWVAERGELIRFFRKTSETEQGGGNAA
jgi:hypothetical protein